MWSAILLSIAYYRIYCTGLYDIEIRLEAAQSRVNDENVYSYSSAEEEEAELHDTTEQKSSLEMVTQPQDVEDVNDFPSLLPQRSLETTNRNNKISP